MAYTPTGRPVGRPKTKEYQTISLKIPQALLDRVQRYARLHQQSISELIRDGLEWRITDGDPRGLGVSAPQPAGNDAVEYYRNTVVASALQGEAETGVLQEILAALARQERQLHALTQAQEPHAVVSIPLEYSNNTENRLQGQPNTPEPDPEEQSKPTPQETLEINCNTVLHKEISTLEPATQTLGPLCKHGHAYQGTGQSLRSKKSGECVRCVAERQAKRRQGKRQA